MLSEQRVLFICTPFHEYPFKIKGAIENLNAKVDMFFIEGRSFLSTLLLNANHHLYHRFRIYQQNQILKKTRHKKYDIVFIQYPYFLGENFYKKLKISQPYARYINYNWDSIEARDFRPFMKYFDAIYSFDPYDCETNPGVKFLPLFYSDDFANHATTQKKYDLTFIGGLGDSKNRYEFIRMVEKICGDQGIKFYKHLYCSKNFFIKSLLKGKIFHGISFRKLTLSQIASRYHDSICILDYQNPKQRGLTMRTFEVLGSGCKLITTNKNILSADFMDPELIQTIDKDNPRIFKEFILKEISGNNNFDGYSLNNWIKKILYN